MTLMIVTKDGQSKNAPIAGNSPIFLCKKTTRKKLVKLFKDVIDQNKDVLKTDMAKLSRKLQMTEDEITEAFVENGCFWIGKFCFTHGEV